MTKTQVPTNQNLKTASLLTVPVVTAELVLAFFVILGGAFVRATGSGAGCGEHWPLCNGQTIPINPKIETVIEFSHRLSSGFSLLLFVAIFFSAVKHLPKKSACLAWAKVALVSFLLEAAIGAVLVLKKLVTTDTSLLRAGTIALHLVNTYLLLGALAGMLWNLHHPNKPRSPKSLAPRWRAILFGWCFVGAAGAIAALGDTLFPALSLAHGLGQDLASDAHFLTKLRVVHPIVAIALSLFTVVETQVSADFAPAGRWVRSLIFLQVAFGVLNWLLLAPVWMQLVHLLLADVTWVAIVWYALSTSEINPVPDFGRELSHAR